MFGSTSIKDSFCLIEPFEGFSPNAESGISPTRTSGVLMATNLSDESKMSEHAEIRLTSRMMPKFIIKGEYGSGKTHLANRIGSQLKSKFADDGNMELLIVNIEIGEVLVNTNFEYLFVRMMDAAFSRENIEQALSAFKSMKAAAKSPDLYSDEEYVDDLTSIFDKVSASNDAVNAVLKISQFAIQPSLSAEGYAELYSGTTGLAASDERVRLLDCLAKLFQRANNQCFMFIIDQANMLNDVTQANAKMSWKAATIEQAEDENSAFGWVYVTGSDAETPDWYLDSQVLTRLGGADEFENPAITNIQGFADMDACELFFTQLFETVIDQSVLANHRADDDAGWTDTDLHGETFDAAKYPFTEESLQRYVDTFAAQSDPVRTHLQRLHRLAVFAIREGRNVIIEEDVEKLTRV